MKKHITLLSGLLLVSGAFAQKTAISSTKEYPAKMFNTGKPVSAPATEAPKALGTAFWSDDFSTPGNWTIDNDGQSGATFGWNINSTEDSWYFNSPVNSTSDGNFAEVNNGNPTTTPGTQALNVEYTLTTANPIALSMGTEVALTFMQYGAHFYDKQEMLISTDGTNFVSVGSNSDVPILSASGGSAYTNPTIKSINISQYLTAATQVWIQFKWTTDIPAQASNPNVWVAYGWMLDDVQLTTLPDYDLSILSTYWGTAGLGYYQIPTTQIQPIDFSINVLNNGGQDMTNVVYGVNVTGAATYNGSSASTTIAAGATDSLFMTAQFTPSAVGTYNIAQSLTATNPDDLPGDNALTNFPIAVTNFVYARDNGTAAGYTNNGTTGFEVGNLYDIWANQTLYGINVHFDGGTTANTEIYARVYDAADFSFIAETDPIQLTASQITNGVTFFIDGGLALTAGKTYLVMVGSFDGTLKVATAGVSDKQTSFFIDGNDITVTANVFYTTETPMVRLNFDPSLSVSESDFATGVTSAPNPFGNETKVSFNLKNDAAVSLVVTDMAGRTVYSVASANMTAGNQTISIDGAGLNAGVYNYSLKVGDSVITNRIVKK